MTKLKDLIILIEKQCKILNINIVGDVYNLKINLKSIYNRELKPGKIKSRIFR